MFNVYSNMETSRPHSKKKISYFQNTDFIKNYCSSVCYTNTNLLSTELEKIRKTF